MTPVSRARLKSGIGWTLSVGFFFALQFYAVRWLARLPVTQAPTVAAEPATRLWIPRDAVEEQTLVGRYHLPLSARAGLPSFSRAAERALPMPQYRLDEVTATPKWLPADAGIKLASAVAPARLITPPRAPAELPATGTNTVNSGLMATQTVVAVKGALAGRSWQSPVRLPVWTNTAPLRPTVIEVAVNAHGEVLVPTLLASSGDKAADASALDLARKARFQPLKGSPSDELTWGRMIVQWVTASPQASPSPSLR